MPSKFSKFLANILDDVAVLFATMAGVLLTAYIRQLLAVFDGAVWDLQAWPKWYVVVPAGIIALVVAISDAQKGDPEGRKRNIGKRAGQGFLMGIAWRSLLTLVTGGGG